MIKVEQMSADLRLFSGELIWPDNPVYDLIRKPYNPRHSRRPALIARCRGNRDVVAALSWAWARNLEIAVRSTGHSYAGFSSTDGVIIDLSLMRGVRVDPLRRVARILGGTLGGDIQREASIHGLAAATGALSTTGAGLFLGGGGGYLRNSAGWCADNILSADLVTADGRLVTASTQDNPDLLWAIRGAGANFGIVTSLELQLYPVPPKIAAGSMYWSDRRMEEAIRILRDYRPRASNNLFSLIMPKIDHLDETGPEVARGQPVVQLLYCHTGDPEQAAKELGELRRLCAPDHEVRAPTEAFDELHDWLDPTTARKDMDAYSVTELRDDVIGLLCDMTRRMGWPQARRMFEVFDHRGRLSETPSIPSSQPRPLPDSWSLRPQATYHDASSDASHDAWMDEVIEALKRTGLGVEDVYLTNMTSRPTSDARVRDSFGANYDRLAELKAIWDPENVFHKTLNIPPRLPR